MFASLSIVLDDVHSITAQIDALRVDAAVMHADDVASVVEAFAVLRAKVDAVWLALVARADLVKVHRDHSARDTAAWIAAVTGERRGVARRDVDLAAELTIAPLVAESLGDGVSK